MEKLFVSRQSRHFPFDVLLLNSTFPYLYLDFACKQLSLPPGKGINRRNESTISELSEPFRDSSELYRTSIRISVQLLLIDSTDDIQPVIFYSVSSTKTVKLQFDSTIERQSIINHKTLFL